MKSRFLSLSLLVIYAVGSAASAGSVSLAPVKDNTLIQWSPETPGANPLLSNALGDVFVGRTNQDGQEEATISIRRGLVQFDVAGAIPNGATITSVTLTMRDVMGLNGDPTVSLHAVLQDWGEGTSFFPGGQGAAATDGDATWLHAVYDADNPASSSFWSTPGGDYSPTVSASSIVFDDAGGGQLFSWSSAGLVADVQNWASNPASNFGWLLRGDETRGQSAKRFNSSESTTFPNVPPQLTIEYAFAGDYNDDGAVDAADYVVWRKLLDTTVPLANETVTPGLIGSEDYDVWVAEFGRVFSGTGGASEVPEPGSCILAIVGVGVIFVFRRVSRLVRIAASVYA